MVQSDSTGAGILDAAMRVLVEFGFRSATVELTAKDAGVSPAAIYRRWPTTTELFRTAVSRELTTLFDDAFDSAATEQSFDDVVTTAFTTIVWTVHNHPLTVRELNTEPESTVRFLSTESGPVLDAAVILTTTRLADAAHATGRRLDDPEALADTLVRLIHAVLVVPDPTRPFATRADVAAYADRYVAPLADAAEAAKPSAIQLNPARRRRSLQLLSPLALALLLGSGALASALVAPWSPSVTPTTANVSTPPAPPPSTDSAVPLPIGPGAGPVVAESTVPAPPEAISTPAEAPSPTAAPTLDIPTPSETGSRSPNKPNPGPPPRSPMPPTGPNPGPGPGSRPPNPGPPPHPTHPGAPGGPTGSGSQSAGRAGGPP